jgi:hypothetical protein
MNKSRILRFSVAAGVILAVAGAGVNLSTTRSLSEKGAEKDPPLRLVLNVPAHKIFVFENGKYTREFRVGVGMVGNETPAGRYRLTQAIWNPWWNPPKSDWAEGRKAEPPGPGNPMGRVKMNFAPLLYIHGTQYRNGVGDPSSHGCVHVMNEDLIELAKIVHKYATPTLKEGVLEELIDSPSETREINFRNSIPFDVVYDVASVVNNFLYVYPDVYGRVKDSEYPEQVRDVLTENGIDVSSVDQAKLDRLVTRGREIRVSMSLDTLLAAAPTAVGAVTPKSASGTKAARAKASSGSKSRNESNVPDGSKR